MCFSAILGGASALIGASSSKKAAKAQQQAAAAQLALEGRIYDETVQRFEPFLNSGTTAQNALAFELGLGPRPMIGGVEPQIEEIAATMGPNNPEGWQEMNQYQLEEARRAGGTPASFRVNGQTFATRAEAEEYARNNAGGSPYEGFKATPGYDFRRQSGIDAIDGSAASRGSLFSGATLKAQQTFGDNLASQEYGNYINRLTSMAGQGQAAAGNAANAGANYAAGAGQAYGAMGNAASAGAIGVGNALQGGLNTGLGIWKYQQAQSAGQNALAGGGGFSGIGIGGLY